MYWVGMALKEINPLATDVGEMAATMANFATPPDLFPTKALLHLLFLHLTQPTSEGLVPLMIMATRPTSPTCKTALIETCVPCKWSGSAKALSPSCQM